MPMFRLNRIQRWGLVVFSLAAFTVAALTVGLVVTWVVLGLSLVALIATVQPIMTEGFQQPATSDASNLALAPSRRASSVLCCLSRRRCYRPLSLRHSCAAKCLVCIPYCKRNPEYIDPRVFRWGVRFAAISAE
jgi:hypothetical protein